MKFIILQDVPYRRPEGALAQYHGAIWAEELRRRGHEATKMVLGDPHAFVPESPLLSMSTNAQRVDPSFWNNVKADCVLYYANPSTDCVRVVKAIKKGSPATLVISRIEAFWAPNTWSIRRVRESFVRQYMEARHCPTERFDRETRAILPALARTVAGEAVHWIRNPARSFFDLAADSDFTTFFFPSLVSHAKDFLLRKRRPDLADKVCWAGYPVRTEFHPPKNGSKRPHSIVSIANWRHFKDPELTAEAMTIVLANDPDATFTIAGERSERVTTRIFSAMPEATSRVRAFHHVDNWSLPALLSESQVFLLCSRREGIPSVLSEALCCGCSLALAPGPAVGAFREFIAEGDGTQATSRDPRDMAHAVLSELDQWRSGKRNATNIAGKWHGSLVSELCDDLFRLARGRDW